ncbi:hypothetical protein HNR46_003430 [Haloferula luteola]|uniref:Fibronectin type-III domain-containing protein n=1 Tax=Haloferula luteola TaxID=595692 RepID=A0A840V802_9BACT|nr:hypothetical protein [Haloferula luteola]
MRHPWRANPTQGTIPFPSPNLRICRSVIAGLVVGGLVVVSQAAPSRLHLELDPPSTNRVSDDGTVDLQWLGGTGPFELQQATSEDFGDAKTRYRGSDTETVITGLREGSYHFRVREITADGKPTNWSEPLMMEVHYLSRGQLFLLLGTGAFVTTLTLGAIVHGFLRHR